MNTYVAAAHQLARSKYKLDRYATSMLYDLVSAMKTHDDYSDEHHAVLVKLEKELIKRDPGYRGYDW